MNAPLKKSFSRVNEYFSLGYFPKIVKVDNYRFGKRDLESFYDITDPETKQEFKAILDNVIHFTDHIPHYIANWAEMMDASGLMLKLAAKYPGSKPSDFACMVFRFV